MLVVVLPNSSLKPVARILGVILPASIWSNSSFVKPYCLESVSLTLAILVLYAPSNPNVVGSPTLPPVIVFKKPPDTGL